MNIYEKMNNVKEWILKANLKKSGKNAFAKYEYYELSDFLPTIVKLCKENKLFTQIIFTEETAILNIINTEKSDEVLVYSSPMKSLELKGCNKVQALWWVQTYQRRYLYMNAFDIVESDMFDWQKQEECKVELKDFWEDNWKKFTEKGVNLYKTAEEAIEAIEKKYVVNDEYKEMIRNLYFIKEDQWKPEEN